MFWESLLAKITCDYNSLPFSLIISSRIINLYLAVPVFYRVYIFCIGTVFIQSVFRACLDVTSVHFLWVYTADKYYFRFMYIVWTSSPLYNDNLRCLLYLFTFGHVFFRASANCRLYQTADSTETPLLAQVLSSLSFPLSCVQSPSVCCSHAWPDSEDIGENESHSCITLVLHSSCSHHIFIFHIFYNLNVA